MEKAEAIKMALELVKAIIETKQLGVESSKAKDLPKDILKKMEALAKGIKELEKKI